MSITPDTDRLKLPVALDLHAAEELLMQLRRRLASGAAVSLDASGVETVTLASMQIILSALASNMHLRIERASPAFVGAFDELGLGLGDALVAAEIETDDHIEDTGAEPASEAPTMKRILTIDDSKTIRDMLRLTLVDAGFDVLQAVDGRDGTEVLARERVDLVITDINMPNMDGYDVIRHIRRDDAHKGMPILVLTTESEVEKRNIAREAGATGWMVKPFDPDRLVATINKVVA
jgi:two-component system chemotaxis response regulator CheY